MAAFWPGPLTVVFPARSSVPRLLTGGIGTVGIR
ncbi:MAG: threonylcarbamoyl-AMP synthase, partial [Candidatus Electrothrix sp. AR4]|nr:threonylcarbamoyl-AMP synthase [Candidatus Electrothrix sp. AR4]